MDIASSGKYPTWVSRLGSSESDLKSKGDERLLDQMQLLAKTCKIANTKCIPIRSSDSEFAGQKARINLAIRSDLSKCRWGRESGRSGQQRSARCIDLCQSIQTADGSLFHWLPCIGSPLLRRSSSFKSPIGLRQERQLTHKGNCAFFTRKKTWSPSESSHCYYLDFNSPGQSPTGVGDLIWGTLSLLVEFSFLGLKCNIGA